MENYHLNTKKRILMAARKLFAKQGFEATTVRQICDEAKTNSALISYYFGGKESVYCALFDMFFPKDGFCSDHVSGDPVEEIRFIMERLIEFKIEQPEMVAILQQEILMNSPRFEGMVQYIYPAYKKLKELLELGKVQNLFHFESTDNAITFIIAVITFPLDNAFVSTLFSERNQEAKNVYSDTLKFVFDGLGYVG